MQVEQSRQIPPHAPILSNINPQAMGRVSNSAPEGESRHGGVPDGLDAPIQPISRDWLYWRLVWAAMLRSGVTMLAFVFGFFALGFFVFIFNPGMAFIPIVGAMVFGLLVSGLMTVYYCRRAVRCPNCQHSLWNCGTGNFKPRRMRVRHDVTACPNCHAPIG